MPRKNRYTLGNPAHLAVKQERTGVAYRVTFVDSNLGNTSEIEAALPCAPLENHETLKLPGASGNLLQRSADAKNDQPQSLKSPKGKNGERGIRTPVTVSHKPDFESGAFNHSATLPYDSEIPSVRVKWCGIRVKLTSTFSNWSPKF